MKIEKTIITLLVLCFTSALKSQEMSYLYNKTIDDCYKKLYNNINTDSMYISDFSTCENSNFPYSISTENKKIKIGLPKVNEKNPFRTVYKLNYPELEGANIVISLGIYSVRYSHTNTLLIFNGVILYKFKYNKRKKAYILAKPIKLEL